MVKLHVMAFAGGVERIFWYNYKDRGNDPTDVEDHFGMVDYDGAFKPVYWAHKALVECMQGKYSGSRTDAAPTRIYTFTGSNGRCHVVWNYPFSTRTLALSTISPGLTSSQVAAAVNTTGSPIATTGSQVVVSGAPIMITTTQTGTNP
jgi:hypothetical protein